MTALLLALVCCGSGATAQESPTAIFVVIHIDMESSRTADGLALLRTYVGHCHEDQANVSEQLLQELHRPNHITLVEGWRSETAYEAHLHSKVTRDFRTGMQPLLGSPFDERLHRSLSY